MATGSTRTKTVTVKACPFCGHKGQYLRRGTFHLIRCTNLGCGTMPSTAEYEDPSAAIGYWNARTRAPARKITLPPNEPLP